MKRKIFWSLGVGALVLLGFLFGPNCIHLFYRVMTPRTVILSNRFEYNILEGEESRLSPEARKASVNQRMTLFLWFHARGLNIDEDDEARSIWHPWAELMEYWKLGSD
jgi:hypothetical protein